MGATPFLCGDNLANKAQRVETRALINELIEPTLETV